MIKPLRERREGNPPKLGKFSNHSHPFVKFIWKEIIRQRVSLSSVADSAGVERSNIHKWRYSEKGPYLLQLEAVLLVLGYELKIVKRGAGKEDK